ncbi:MerR family DNA-binding transcriptional regulator [Elstera litoralis]|uniref:MerR family DNA-binding transcriptional regulator n=1 Tax=Elstera litoralis TaxID=552518 RepID=UPI0006968D00|nr:MerR family DNA-binding transcriptional regulator [Elstera litoralis]
MKIGDLAARCGLSVHTLRYYERIGLLPRIARDQGQQRVYDSAALVWIAFLGRLKTTGMPIQKNAALCGFAGRRAEHGGGAAGFAEGSSRRGCGQDCRAYRLSFGSGHEDCGLFRPTFGSGDRE